MPDAKLDPVSLEILWSRLIAVADEQAAVVVRTAFSHVVRDSHDFSCVLLTPTGDLLAQPFQSLPGFTRAASAVMRHFLSRWKDWHTDDVAVTNDPWLAAGHLNDMAIAVPVFHHGRLVAFAANIAHQSDIGGRGYSADADSIFEEGLAIPPMKLYREGRPVQEVLDILAQNVRVPDEVLGDVQAQIGAARLAAQRTRELLEEVGIPDLADVSTEILARSEVAMRRAIAAVPDGVYEHEGTMDGYDKPLKIRVKLTIQGDNLELDFAGTSDQVRKGINSSYNYTYGYAAFAVKAALEPLVPNNEGAYRPIVLKAPLRSLVNCERPAPVSSRGRVGHMLVPVVFGALAQAVPGGVPAEPGSPAPRLNFFGPRGDGTQFQCNLITSGGLGASRDRDGLPGKAFPTNTKMASLEVMESIAPIRFLRRELVTDSGGEGRHRGGLAQEISVQVLGDQEVHVSTSSERIKHPPQGYSGGGSGFTASLSHNDGRHLAPKARTLLKPGDIVTVRTPAGGGYGPANERSEAAIALDERMGYISPDRAKALRALHRRPATPKLKGGNNDTR